jgi:hypothetical protein
MLNENTTYADYIDELKQEYQLLLTDVDVNTLTDEDKLLLNEIEDYLDDAILYASHYPNKPIALAGESLLDPELQEFVDDLISEVVNPVDSYEEPQASELVQAIENGLAVKEKPSKTRKIPFRSLFTRSKMWSGASRLLGPIAVGCGILIFIFYFLANTDGRQLIGSVFNSDTSGEFSETAAISSDGHIIVFQSPDNDIVASDTNDTIDIFIFDRERNVYELVSVDSSGNQANSDSINPSISADGRYIAFESVADNLVPGDLNNESDIFVHDRETGLTKRISVSSASEEGNGGSFRPSISADGSYVIFFSYATNLTSSEIEQDGQLIIHNLETQENTVLEK